MKLTLNAKLLAAGIALLLNGCAATIHRPYMPPNSGEQAFLRISDRNGVGLPGRVMIATFDKGEDCRGRSWMQGIPSNFQQTEVTNSFAKIRAGQSFSVAIHYAMGAGTVISTPASTTLTSNFCAPVVNFVPEPNQYYRIKFSVNNGGCLTSLEAADNPSMRASKPVAFKMMTYSRGFHEIESSWCNAS